MNLVGRLVGLVVLCLIVGLFLSVLGISAESLLTDTWGTLRSLALLVRDFVLWAIPYVLLGAIIVVPLAVLGALRRFSGRR